MKTLQFFADKFAISLSVLCTVHCLVLPLLVTLLPTLNAMAFTDERLHLWLLVAVLPSSLFALTLGCRQHQRYPVLVLGLLGLALLMAGVFTGQTLGEWAEKSITVVGSFCLALSHVFNYHLCRSQAVDCACPCAEG